MFMQNGNIFIALVLVLVLVVIGVGLERTFDKIQFPEITLSLRMV